MNVSKLKENPDFGTMFIPEPPFGEYDRGVVWYNKNEDCRFVTLSTIPNKNNSKRFLKKNMSAAEYLFSVKHFNETNQHIPDGFSVDYKDYNRWNDTLSNLHLVQTNNLFCKDSGGTKWSVLICPVCLNQFEILNRIVNSTKERDIVFWCSNKCKLLFKATLHPYKDFKTLREWIAQHQTYKIIVKYPEEYNQDNDLEIISEDMLHFNLEKACGKPLAFESIKLLNDEAKRTRIKNLRLEGKTWAEMEILLGMDSKSMINLVSDMPDVLGPGVKNVERNNKIIHMYNEEMKSSTKIAKDLNMSVAMINLILQGKRTR